MKLQYVTQQKMIQKYKINESKLFNWVKNQIL